MNVELSPIAAPKFEAGRMSDEGVEINRLGKSLYFIMLCFTFTVYNGKVVF